MFQKLKQIAKEHYKDILIILVYLIVLGFMTWIFGNLGVARIQDIIVRGGFWSPFLFIIFHAFTIIVAPFEGSFLMLLSGTLFGYWPGVIYTIIAGFLGSSINFWISRIYGTKIIEKLIGEGAITKINQISQTVDDHPILLIPLMATGLFDIVGYAAGLTRVKYQKFLIAVSLSSLINVPIYVAVGRGLIEGENTIFWLLAGFLLMVVFYLLLRFLQKKFGFKV